MPLPKNRSRSVRKIKKRTPKGITVHYKRRKKGKRHSCSITGKRLQAVISTQGKPKRPNRKFGGNLSTVASSRVLIIASRVKEGELSIDEVDIRMLPYVKRLLNKK